MTFHQEIGESLRFNSTKNRAMSVFTIRSPKDKKHVVQTVDTDREKITYHLLPDTGQANHFKTIELDGFVKLPSGFYRAGYGLSKPAGSFLLRHLSAKIGKKFFLTVTSSGQSSIAGSKNARRIFLKHSDLMELQRNLRSIRSESNIQSNAFVAARLNQLFPKVFRRKSPVPPSQAYKEDKLSKIIYSDSNITKQLSKNDITAIAELYGQLIDQKRFGQTKQQLKIVGKSKGKTEKVLLEKVVQDFESRLKKTHLSENDWQNFFQEFMLLFNTSYVQIIEKLSVSLGGKYPDFILLNVYNYLDIYEIKRPNTDLLKRDHSRGNYYWDAEVCKALTQTENYIDLINKNAHALILDVKKFKNLDIKVVRPRGFVIAGNRGQLLDEKMQDDFRLLSGASKNVDVIPFDDLLNNLKNLVKRL